MLEAREITVRRGGRALLDGVTLRIAPGEVVALAGPNGAGKSTLRRVLAGEWRPAEGSVWLNGRVLADWPAAAQARLRAVLPQDATLNFPFTAAEVALLGRMPHTGRRESAHDYRIAQEALELAGAGELSERLYPTLSGGERQRVQLARVLAQIWDVPTDNACYLLLDEPTSNLDLARQHNTLRVARQLAAKGVGVLAILHDLNLAAQYADRLALLHNGRLVADGPPPEVLTPAHIQQTFDLPVSVINHPNARHLLVLPE